MWSLYVASKLAIFAGYYLLRLIPVVGRRLSDDYENRVFGPLVEDVSVAALSASIDGDDLPASATVELTLDNDSSLGARFAQGIIRLGCTENGRTLHNFYWEGDFDGTPKNVSTEKIESDGSGTVGLESLVYDAPEDDELWLDGELVLQRVFTYRGRELPLGKTHFTVESRSAVVEWESSAAQVTTTEASADR